MGGVGIKAVGGGNMADEARRAVHFPTFARADAPRTGVIGLLRTLLDFRRWSPPSDDESELFKKKAEATSNLWKKKRHRKKKKKKKRSKE